MVSAGKARIHEGRCVPQICKLNAATMVECELLPSLHVERREGLEGSLTCEKLEAALCVLDPSHTKEPHQEVEAIHEDCAKHRSLWQTHHSCFVIGTRTWSLQLSGLQAEKYYLSYRFFFQVSSGTTGNCHIVLIVQTDITGTGLTLRAFH